MTIARLAFFVTLLLASTARAAEPVTAEQLMRLFAANPATRADFVEKKTLTSLDRPLESSGELVYTAPSRLEKRTVKPKPETLVADGDTLSIERNGTRRSLSLRSFPEIAPFVASVRAALAGDLPALSRDYRIAVDGTLAQWRLVLLPSDPKIAAVVSRLVLTGQNGRIETFEVLQADGNRSLTTITPHADAR